MLASKLLSLFQNCRSLWTVGNTQLILTGICNKYVTRSRDRKHFFHHMWMDKYLLSSSGTSFWFVSWCDFVKWNTYLQSMRLKIIAAASSAERRFSSWIGGSILASLVSWKMWHATEFSSFLIAVFIKYGRKEKNAVKILITSFIFVYMVFFVYCL